MPAPGLTGTGRGCCASLGDAEGPGVSAAGVTRRGPGGKDWQGRTGTGAADGQEKWRRRGEQASRHRQQGSSAGGHQRDWEDRKRGGPSTGEQEGGTGGMRVSPKAWPWQGGLTPTLPVSVEEVAWGLGEGVGW